MATRAEGCGDTSSGRAGAGRQGQQGRQGSVTLRPLVRAEGGSGHPLGAEHREQQGQGKHVLEFNVVESRFRGAAGPSPSRGRWGL